MPQRRAVAEVRHGRHVHLTAEAVLAQARLPGISLATVDNPLNDLVSMGEVSEVSAGGGSERYDPHVAERHHHLVCTHRGELLDVRPAGKDRLHVPPAQRHGYEVGDVEIVFRGLCRRCRPAGARR